MISSRKDNLSEVQIDRKALGANAGSIRKLIPGSTNLIAVVKGNAYGHGIETVVSVLDPLVDGFQVDDIEELRQVRKISAKRILVLGYVPRQNLAEAMELGGEISLYDSERLDALADISPAKVHLKIDALLGRQGVVPRDLPDFLRELKKRPNVQVLTAYAHFANIEDTTDLVHAQDQIAVFKSCFVQCRAAFPEIGSHMSATSAMMALDNSSDLVRIGIGLYGMYPSVSLQRSHSDLELSPVLRWVSHLAQVKVLPPRHPVGYGLTFITSKETKVGIVPQGYADGYDRGLSNVGEVLVRGRRCPVIGRVAMNMFAVDLTSVPEAAAEDEVVLLGRQDKERISAEEMASRIGTINYEVATRISCSLPRVLI